MAELKTAEAKGGLEVGREQEWQQGHTTGGEERGLSEVPGGHTGAGLGQDGGQQAFVSFPAPFL